MLPFCIISIQIVYFYRRLEIHGQICLLRLLSRLSCRAEGTVSLQPLAKGHSPYRENS